MNTLQRSTLGSCGQAGRSFGAHRAVVACALAALVVTACGGEPPGSIDQPQVGRVEVTPTSLVLTVGSQQKLSATVFSTTGDVMASAAVTWSTDAATIANVAQDGTVSALAAGTANITATSGTKTKSIAVTVTPGSTGGTGTIVVNSATRYQTITGWEAHAQSGFEDPTFPLYKNQLFDLAVNDLGINRLRLEVRSGSENTVDYYTQWRRGLIDNATWRCQRYATVNDDNNPQVRNTAGFQFSDVDSTVENVVLPMRQRLTARGEKLFLNLEYVAFIGQICTGLTYNHTDPQEYAEFILATTDHLKTKYGLIPDSWEVILEPDNNGFWRGKQIGDAIVATAARLAAAGYTPKFIAPSTSQSVLAVPYMDTLLARVPAAKPYLLELSYHRYSATNAGDLQTIAARAAQNGMRASMLEHIASGHEDLQADLKLANVTAWQQFALAFPGTPGADDGSKYYLVDKTNASNPQIIMASRTKFLRQYFKFIRAGAVRIDATSANGALDPSAFINPDGGFVVVVNATAAATFTVAGLPAAQYGIKYTTATAYDVNHPDVTITAGQAISTSIPAAGVLTIYRK